LNKNNNNIYNYNNNRPIVHITVLVLVQSIIQSINRGFI